VFSLQFVDISNVAACRIDDVRTFGMLLTLARVMKSRDDAGRRNEVEIFLDLPVALRLGHVCSLSLKAFNAYRISHPVADYIAAGGIVSCTLVVDFHAVSHSAKTHRGVDALLC
jgi:hypothetical protein